MIGKKDGGSKMTKKQTEIFFCPNCRSKEITGDGMDFENHTRIVNCNGCGSKYSELWKCVGYVKHD